MAKRSLSSTTSPIIRAKADSELPSQLELVGVSPTGVVPLVLNDGSNVEANMRVEAIQKSDQGI